MYSSLGVKIHIFELQFTRLYEFVKGFTRKREFLFFVCVLIITKQPYTRTNIMNSNVFENATLHRTVQYNRWLYSVKLVGYREQKKSAGWGTQ